MTPDQPFEAPWQAEVFALTVALSEAGHVAWPDWTAHLGAELARREVRDADSYYQAWLAALETLCAARDLAGAQALSEIKARWEAAYLATPHGAPVRLSSV